MQKIIVEKHLLDHPRFIALTKRRPNARVLTCDKYTEVFNPKAQNFRLQKQNPAWIIAEKKGRAVLPVPDGFGLDAAHNFYFSHLLNCPYDCRYCFLQGMYRSANYVWFINYDYYKQQIIETLEKHKGEKCVFFSGYDADSMALDAVTDFTSEFVPWFTKQKNAVLELRTKSATIKNLLSMPASDNVVVAFSMTPEIISKQVEHKTPSLQKRLQAMSKLAAAGWPIGLRFDPIIDAVDFKQQYQQLIEQVFTAVSPHQIHSVTVGPLRFPAKMLDKIMQLYPEDKMLSSVMPLDQGKTFAYQKQREQEMINYVLALLSNYIKDSQVFNCFV